MPTLQRKSIRLKGYDYTTEGAYFITIVTCNRESLFGEIHDGEMVLNDYGRIVESTWHGLVNHNSNIGLDEFVVMPNHVHGIIVVFEPVGAGSQPACEIGAGFSLRKERSGAQRTREPAPTRKSSLSEIVRQFKTFSARRINALRGTPGVPVWQRNYYDHIIRSDRENEEVAVYIANNPANWLMDSENL